MRRPKGRHHRVGVGSLVDAEEWIGTRNSEGV